MMQSTYFINVWLHCCKLISFPLKPSSIFVRLLPKGNWLFQFPHRNFLDLISKGVKCRLQCDFVINAHYLSRRSSLGIQLILNTVADLQPRISTKKSMFVTETENQCQNWFKAIPLSMFGLTESDQMEWNQSLTVLFLNWSGMEHDGMNSILHSI